MPEYLAPGVYVEEVSFRNKSIEGVSTTTTGFVGAARYGPVDLDPDIITSLVEFERVYGDRGQLSFVKGAKTHNYLWHGVRAFFEEGGKRLYVSRLFRPHAVQGSGSSVEAIYWSPDELIDDDRTLEMSATDATLYADGHARYWMPSAPTLPSDSRDASLLVRARFPGAAGNMRVTLTVKSGQNILATDSKGVSTASSLREYDTVWVSNVASPVDSAPGSGGFYVARYEESEQTWRFTQNSDPTAPKSNSDLRLADKSGSGFTTLDAGQGDQVRVLTLNVTVASEDGSTTSVWTGIALDPNHSDTFGAPDSLTKLFLQKPNSMTQARTLPIVILAGKSADTGGELLNALLGASSTLGTAINDVKSSDADRSVSFLLAGGSDGQLPLSAEYGGEVNTTNNARTGLKAFEALEDISIVAAPGSTANFAVNQSEASATVNLLISHAEYMRYRIAVIDSGDNQAISDVREMRGKIDSSYAALYYPWVRVVDPVTNTEINLPPSGFVSGIYARNDVERAVYKAPANEVVRLAVGFERLLNKAQQEVLNPEGVNCFRFFEGRGMRLWGARTATSDPEWKYVNLRRYFAYLERSIDKGTQWAVFEPNGPRLWDNVRSTIADFLLNEWTMGALLGDKPEKSYFVRCDRSTMTQNDLDNGRLVCLIGVAPLRPAEFVIFRIGQWTADRKV
jgi:phage tail sheath protein FI